MHTQPRYSRRSLRSLRSPGRSRPAQPRMIDRCGVRIPHRRAWSSCPIVWRGSAQVGLVWMKWVRGHAMAKRGTERVVDVWPVARVRVSRVVAPRIARREGWLPGCPGPTRLRAASRNASKKLRASRSQLRDHSSLDSYHLAAPVRRDFLRFRLQFAGRVRPGPDGTGIAPGGQAEDRASGQQQRR